MGERDYRIFVENLNNFADTLAVDILTSVVCETHGEGLRIQTEGGDLLEGGSVLQFDNCYTGIPMSRRLKIKNTTVKSMDISLGSDRPREVRDKNARVGAWGSECSSPRVCLVCSSRHVGSKQTEM